MAKGTGEPGERSGTRKTILITGAASGIGAETARYFADRDWFVGLYDVNAAGLETVAGELGPDRCISGTLDVTQREDWGAAVAQFSAATGGRMDVLFNNAGIARFGWIEEIPQDEADRMIDINLKGVVNGVYACLDALKQTPNARIVNTASVAGIVGSPRIAVYSATKFAVRGLTEALDVELKDHGIRATTLMPWFVETPILNSGTTGGGNEDMAAELREQGADVYPVSLAAEQAWAAAHGEEVHYRVGKAADQAAFAARFMPKRLRRQLVKNLPERE
ncbi:MAG: SDR family oxidoreductase [Pseudomonadota bacterium]